MKTILGLGLAAMLTAGCNVHDEWEPVSASITSADCEYRKTIPDTAAGSDTYLYRIDVEGEVQGPTDADAEAKISLLSWTPTLDCPDWGGNCRRDSMESGTSPFDSRIDLAMSEERMSFEFSVAVNGWDADLNESWIGEDSVSVTCVRYADGE